MNRQSISLGAIFSLLGLALGASGAHALGDTLDARGHDMWHPAVFCQRVRSLALPLVVLAAALTATVPRCVL